MCMDRLDLDRGAGLRTSFSSLSLPHTRIFTGYLRIYTHLLASRGVKNSECLGVASSHDKGGALLSLPELDLPPSMHTAVLSVLSVDEDKPSRRQIGILRGAPLRLWSGRAWATGSSLQIIHVGLPGKVDARVLTDRCHRKGYLQPGYTMWLLLFVVLEGDDDDNDVQHAIVSMGSERNYAFLTDIDGPEGPVPDCSRGSAPKSWVRAVGAAAVRCD
jgi:hypothetical protein